MISDDDFLQLCKTGKAEAVRQAIEAGANVNALDIHLRTPLMMAARFNPEVAVITALVEAGAEINARDKSGWTPLMFAARFSPEPAVIEVLIEKGADPELTDKTGKKAIDYAQSNPALQGNEVLDKL
ncbi:MAG: uncharacterized protein PWP04_1892 [Candidatus Atribacteria bacterium]|nr:uncharacterized protein [Candidatus Atribacteria bacterium]